MQFCNILLIRILLYYQRTLTYINRLLDKIYHIKISCWLKTKKKVISQWNRLSLNLFFHIYPLQVKNLITKKGNIYFFLIKTYRYKYQLFQSETMNLFCSQCHSFSRFAALIKYVPEFITLTEHYFFLSFYITSHLYYSGFVLGLRSYSSGGLIRGIHGFYGGIL